MEDITDADYMHAKRVCNDFETKTLSECHDLYVQSDILLLANLFSNFWNMCLEIYISLIMLIFFLHQDWHDKQPSKRHK